MPHLPKKPCRYPGCAELTNELYCEKHKKEMNKQYNQHERDLFSKTFYSSPKWREVRKRKLQQQPFCEECKRNGTIIKATIVDHIVPIKQGGQPYDMNNLQSLCWSCHSRKSVKEGSRFGNVQARQ